MNSVVESEVKELKVSNLQKIETLIARVLKIPEVDVTDDLKYREIVEWDSLAHVNLILEIEKVFGVNIDIDLRTKLTSVWAIRSYIQQFYLSSSGKTDTNKNEKNIQNNHESKNSYIANIENYSEHKAPTIYRGLAGVVFDRTYTTLINGSTGELYYRGYSINDLAENSTFEEVAYLLLYGVLPTHEELISFSDKLNKLRSVPDSIITIIRSLKHARPIEVIRTVVSALATIDEEKNDNSEGKFKERAVRLIAQIPTVITIHHALRSGKEIIKPNPSLSHAANFLYMLHGEVPSDRAIQIMDKVFILHADHGSNASAFTTRVVVGTHSDLYAGLTAAICAFAGSLHGGAVENVLSMLNEIGEPTCAYDYVYQKIQKNEPVMGFGHRVYQTEDPRANHLRKMAYLLCKETGKIKLWDIAQSVVDVMQPYAEKGIDVNVDFYASIIYHVLGIPQDIFITAFVSARMPGWISQAREQMENNILIRPILEYVGEVNLPYIPVNKRNYTVGS